MLFKTRTVRNVLQLTNGIQFKNLVVNTGIKAAVFAALKVITTVLHAQKVKYGMQFKEFVVLLEILNV